jgi:hypothetical protein
MTRHITAALFLLAAAVGGAVPDRGTEAKALFFDRKYAEAREAWTSVTGSEAAAYWIARCSESLGEYERALGEYAGYLARRPRDARLAEEARTSRVSLAMRLYKAGRTVHLPIVVDSLRDPSRTVRYFAALQLAGLGRESGRPAIPVLRGIVEDEHDPDLVERAKLALLRLDPRTLSPAARSARGTAEWIKVRVYERGGSSANVSIDVPLALAELVFKSLPDDTRTELKGRGYEADSFLRKLRELGPTRILDIRGDDGERVQIWIE